MTHETKAKMKWETKYNAYNAILALDKGRPLTTLEKDQEIRLAKRLKALSKKKEAKDIANAIIERKFKDLADKQNFFVYKSY